jgi:hypothetical protein
MTMTGETALPVTPPSVSNSMTAVNELSEVSVTGPPAVEALLLLLLLLLVPRSIRSSSNRRKSRPVCGPAVRKERLRRIKPNNKQPNQERGAQVSGVETMFLFGDSLSKYVTHLQPLLMSPIAVEVRIGLAPLVGSYLPTRNIIL